MNALTRYFSELTRATLDGWNRFWFTPADPATLGLVRILAGAMLFYTHLVWSLDLEAFFGPQAWISPTAAKVFLGDNYCWSYLWLVNSPTLLWALHIASLAIIALLTVGLFTRVVSILAFVVAISYVNRVPGALFGLDQINLLLVTYLMIGPSGDAFSLDRLRAARRLGHPLPIVPSVGANLATRLMQVHMAVIYFFAGLSKMQGLSWWSGSAIWGAVANLEYQSVDLTWLAGYPLLVAFLSQVTAWWELTFAVFVWPRLLRPLVLAVAIPLHLGISLFLGMMTFGLVMLIALVSFVPPEWLRAVTDRGAGRAGQGGNAQAAGSGESAAEQQRSGGRAAKSSRRGPMARTKPESRPAGKDAK